MDLWQNNVCSEQKQPMSCKILHILFLQIWRRPRRLPCYWRSAGRNQQWWRSWAGWGSGSLFFLSILLMYSILRNKLSICGFRFWGSMFSRNSNNYNLCKLYYHEFLLNVASIFLDQVCSGHIVTIATEVSYCNWSFL